jgi:hypothetical protein
MSYPAASVNPTVSQLVTPDPVAMEDLLSDPLSGPSDTEPEPGLHGIPVKCMLLLQDYTIRAD